MLQTVLAIAAAAWGVVMGVAPVLQISRMLRRGSSDDVSVAYLAVLVPGFLLGSLADRRSPALR
jgi:MtN3 and saliva related transmembrane protein